MTADPITQAVELLKSGSRDQAARLLAAHLKTNPDSAQAWYLLGISQEDPATRQKCFNRALRLDPGHAGARRALDQLNQGNPASEAIPQSPPSLVRPALIGIALALLVVGIPLYLWVDAGSPPAIIVSLVEGNSSLEPASGDALPAATSTPGPTAALPATWTPTYFPTPSPFVTPTRPAATGTPEGEYGIFRRIQSLELDVEEHLRQEEYVEAIAALDQILALNPRYAHAYFWRASSYNSLLGSQTILSEALYYFDLALEDINHAIQYGPPRPQYYSSRAEIAGRRSGYYNTRQEAEPWLTMELEDNARVLATGGGTWYEHIDLGFALLNLGYCDETLRYLDRLVVVQDVVLEEYWDLMLLDSSARTCLGDYDRALTDLDRNSAESGYANLYMRAEILYAMGRHQEALAIMDDMILDDPTFQGHRYYLRAALLYELGDVDGAVENLLIGSRYTWQPYGLRAYVLGRMADDNGDISAPGGTGRTPTALQARAAAGSGKTCGHALPKLLPVRPERRNRRRHRAGLLQRHRTGVFVLLFV